MICASTHPKPKSRAGTPLPQIAESASVLSCCHSIAARLEGNGSLFDLRCGPVQCSTCNIGVTIEHRIPLTSETDIPLMCAKTKRMVRRYVVCEMAIVLRPRFFLPSRTKSCKSGLVGMANLTKHCLTISPKESKASSKKRAMSVNA